jgi:hypothetical protein
MGRQAVEADAFTFAAVGMELQEELNGFKTAKDSEV